MKRISITLSIEGCEENTELQVMEIFEKVLESGQLRECCAEGDYEGVGFLVVSNSRFHTR